MASPEEWLERIAGIRQWVRRGERAPHKPLLLLYAMGRLQRTGSSEAVGLDAAHVRWWAFEGPDTVDNALCLCSFHHKLLDRGVVGIGDDHTVDVSARFVGHGRAAEVFVLDLLGKPLHEPQRGQALPALNHVQWHRGQVFSGPPRVPI